MPRDWRARQRLATAGLLVGLAAAIVPVTVFNDRFDARRRGGPPERVLYLPKGDTLKFMCLGYTGLAADLVWIRSGLYVGKQLRLGENPRARERKYEWLGKLYQVVSDLDPHWSRPYRVGAILLSALPEDDERALNLLRRGLSRNPGDWEIAYQAAQLNLLRGRNREAVRWLGLISRTMPGHTRLVESILARLQLEDRNYPEALGVAARELAATRDPLMRAVHTSNYREALARLTVARLSTWSAGLRSAGRPAADLRALLETRFGLMASGGRVLPAREHLRLALEPLVGAPSAADFCARLPVDPYGLELYLRADGRAGSRGLERLELARLVAALNPQLKNLRQLLGRPARDLEELTGYFTALHRSNRLSPGLAALLGRPPRLPAFPSGDPGGWAAMPLVEGLLVLPPGPSPAEMNAAPLAIPAPSARPGP